jgi:hypothetical protein
MQDLFMKDSVFSIRPADVIGWLGWLERHAPKQLREITKITLAGPDCVEHAPSYNTLRALKNTLPNLTGVGYQCQVMQYSPIVNENGTIDLELGLGRRWSLWAPVESLDIFAPGVEVVVEGIVWLKDEHIKRAGSTSQLHVRERQGIVRVIRDGKEKGHQGSGWENDDVRLEVVPPCELPSPATTRRAEWKQWWEAAKLKDFATKS